MTSAVSCCHATFRLLITVTVTDCGCSWNEMVLAWRASDERYTPYMYTIHVHTRVGAKVLSLLVKSCLLAKVSYLFMIINILNHK